MLLAILLSASLVLSTSLTVGYGAPQRAQQTEGVQVVRGFLSSRHDRHYLGLYPDERFATIRLTLTVDPIGSPHASSAGGAPVEPADAVNFLVLTEIGLQRFLSGANPWDVNLAAGARVARDGDDGQGTLQLETTFRAVGRGGYTVLVFSAGDAPAIYRLETEGGRLIDGAGQTQPAGMTAPLEPVFGSYGESVNHALAPNALPVAGLGRPSAAPLRSATLGGALRAGGSRHYYVLEPTAANGEMTLSLAHDAPTDQRDLASQLQLLRGYVNFWVVTEAGLRQVEQGAPAEFLSLASGTSFLGVPNLLRTKVRLTAQTAYVIVVYNDSAYPVDYRLRVDGGLLVDMYRQSVEAQSQPLAAGEPEPQHMATPDGENDAPIPALPDPGVTLDLVLPPGIAKKLETGPEADPSPQPPTGEEPYLYGPPAPPEQHEPDPKPERFHAPELHGIPWFHTGAPLQEPSGELQTLRRLELDLTGNARGLWRMQPDGAFGRVVATLRPAADRPIDLAQLRIWVVSQEGLRRVTAGMPPAQATVGGFSVLRLGHDTPVLQASFDPAGYGAYTVIVENLGPEPASFVLQLRNAAFAPLVHDAHGDAN